MLPMWYPFVVIFPHPYHQLYYSRRSYSSFGLGFPSVSFALLYGHCYISLQERWPSPSVLHSKPLWAQKFELQTVMVANMTTLHLIQTADVVRHSLSPPPHFLSLSPLSYYELSKLLYLSSFSIILPVSLVQHRHWYMSPCWMLKWLPNVVSCGRLIWQVLPLLFIYTGISL